MMRSGTTGNQVVSNSSLKGYFYRKQLLLNFKKLNKQSVYEIGTAGNKVNVWI